jgi:hypothetical protein
LIHPPVPLATIELFKSCGFTEEVIRRDILNVYNQEDVTNGPELDIKSVMMYVLFVDFKSCCSNSNQTMTTGTSCLLR